MAESVGFVKYIRAIFLRIRSPIVSMGPDTINLLSARPLHVYIVGIR